MNVNIKWIWVLIYETNSLHKKYKMQYIFKISTATDVLSNVFDNKSHLSLSILIR